MDRNVTDLLGWPGVASSLSARRAWIEIDGNLVIFSNTSSRSPQGERG